MVVNTGRAVVSANSSVSVGGCSSSRPGCENGIYCPNFGLDFHAWSCFCYANPRFGDVSWPGAKSLGLKTYPYYGSLTGCLIAMSLLGPSDGC